MPNDLGYSHEKLLGAVLMLDDERYGDDLRTRLGRAWNDEGTFARPHDMPGRRPVPDELAARLAAFDARIEGLRNMSDLEVRAAVDDLRDLALDASLALRKAT
ncbi:MAG TPA: hypothetical protein VM345_17840 [Acidimicrobiales bacterium]|jgi:hypothetical protein|nr:hypothetical protein [Acidimicrobiales bacterium]